MKIAVVIPALNEARTIAQCLQSVGTDSGDLEVVVVDGGSSDRTREIAANKARVVDAPRGRARQMNAGAAATTGEILLFLHADTRLAPGALRALRETMADPAVVGGTFTLKFDKDTPLLRLYAYCTRLRWRLLRYGDQGVFVRRAVFEALHGYSELPLMEDVDFLARLARAGRTALIPLPVTTSARRFERHGVVRQQLLNTALVALYMAGVSPHRLARWYEQSHR